MTTFSPTVLLRCRADQRPGGGHREPGAAGWGGPPLHHHDFDEAFYVLDGELTFQLGDERRDARPGELAFAGAASTTLANPSAPCALPARLHARRASSATSTARRARLQAASRRPSAPKPYPETTVVGPPIG